MSKVTKAELWFGKRAKDLDESELAEYRRKNAKEYWQKHKKLVAHQKNEWQQMCEKIEAKRKEKELNKKIEPLNNVKFNIMQLNITNAKLKQIEQIINAEIDRIKEMMKSE